MSPTQQLLTPADLVARWENRIKAKTLANWRCLGQGPNYRRYGNRILYPIAEVRKYEEKTQTNF